MAWSFRLKVKDFLFLWTLYGKIMAELWRHLCHGTLHDVNNTMFGSPNREVLANGIRRQHIHALLKKDQLRLQHP